MTNLSDCREVQHKLGTVCIPTEPERIIALDLRHLADPLLALGIKPIGMVIPVYQGEEGLLGLTPDHIEGIENIGNTYQSSMEKILGLDPDLILAMDFAHDQFYEQLSAIAPTVLVDYESNSSFKKNLRYLAQVFDKDAEADNVLSQYQNRIDELRNQLDIAPKDMEVTVLIHFGGEFLVTSSYHTTHEVFSDIGLTNKTLSGRGERTISLEVIDQYDADVLFIIDYEQEGESFFLENPLIAALGAVKNDRVYFVDPDKWSAHGPIGVNRMLDDLFTYLPKKS
ncbi:MAG: iron-siderophore ABC transporter substrate-binding protein [Cyanobacteria bacterium P01_H01_bin.21]